MDKKSLKVLEYNKIIDLLSIKASSSLGLKYIEELTPSPNYEEVKDMLEETSEAESIIKSNEEKTSKEEGEQKPSNPENRPINDIRNEFKEDIKSNTDDEEN